MNPVIRPATAEEIKALSGVAPSFSVKAWAVDYGGKLACVFARTVGTPTPIIFMNMAGDVKAPKATVFKTAQKAMRLLIDRKIPFYAVRNEELCGSRRFLEALGFVETRQKNIFVYEVSHDGD